MSRSFKKNGYSSCVCYSSDKWCRQTYARNRRRKDKAICKECEKTFIDDLLLDSSCSDKFVKSNIDRSVRMADKYSWSSDGGVYFQDDISSLRKEFDETVFGVGYRRFNSKTVWEDYQEKLELVFNKDKREYTIKTKKFIGYDSMGFEVFDTKYITTTEYPPNIIFDDDIIVAGWWKKRNKYFSLSNWYLIDFLFKNSLIPLTFKNSDELISWLRENEEIILRKWLRAKLLRK